ncbi:MAG TPA: hypothetical protein V6C89_14900 [Drouetiella sp.]|jgi:hypothetical protein
MTTTTTRLLVIAASALCACAATASEALADTNSNAKGAQPRVFRPVTADREYACETLTQPVDIPNVPTFTGRTKFITGLRYPNDRSGYRIGLTFAAVEEESQIVEWYRTALTGYGWKLLDIAPDGKTLTAVRDGATFTVRISPNKQPGFRTVVVLSFKAMAR